MDGCLAQSVKRAHVDEALCGCDAALGLPAMSALCRQGRWGLWETNLLPLNALAAASDQTAASMQTGSLGSLGSKVRYRRRTSDQEPPRRRGTSTEAGAPHEVARLSDVKEDEVSAWPGTGECGEH